MKKQIKIFSTEEESNTFLETLHVDRIIDIKISITINDRTLRPHVNIMIIYIKE